MSGSVMEVLGTVREDGSLELDQRLTVSPGRVKVRLEVVIPTSNPREGLLEFIDRERRDLAASGHQFRTKDEIDAELAELRNEWETEEK